MMSEKLESTTYPNATLSAGGSRARTCPSPGSVQVYAENGAGCFGSLFALHPKCVPLSWCSRTYPAYSRRMTGETLRLCLEGLPEWCRRFLATDGNLRASASAHPTDGHVPGECWTRNGSESPNDVAVCSLSDILMPNAPERYYLSRRAARGILRRCEKRGRTLPIALTVALEALAGRKIKRRSYHVSKAPQLDENRKPDHNEAIGDTTANRSHCNVTRSTLPHTRSEQTNETQAKGRGTMSLTPSRPKDSTQAKTGPDEERPLLVRRLTPIECESLQGFPEGWTVADTAGSETPSPCRSPSGSGGG